MPRSGQRHRLNVEKHLQTDEPGVLINGFISTYLGSTGYGRRRPGLSCLIPLQNIARASPLRGEITSRIQLNNFMEANYRQDFPDSKHIAPIVEDDSFDFLAQQWLESRLN